MGYTLRGVIGHTGLLRRFAVEPDMYVVELDQGFALMLLTAALHDRVVVLGGERFGFWFFPDGFGEALAAWSAEGPVAYAEAEFFGGIGMQAAAVWERGQLAFGPQHNAEGERSAPEGSPISQALRYMGANRGYQADEFAAVGLGRHRDIEGWLLEIGVDVTDDHDDLPYDDR